MFKQFCASEANKSGNCANCHQYFKKLTKEHVIPKMFGGTYTIKTCRRCNHSRGHSFTYGPFVSWAREHPNEFRDAIQDAIRNSPRQTLTILRLTANI